MQRTNRSKSRIGLYAASSAIGLLMASTAEAQTQLPPAPEASPEAAKDAKAPDDRNTIIVIGGRTIIAALRNIQPEATYDEDADSTYGVGSVGDVLDEIRRENGDDDPAYLVNGRPVASPDDIAALPAEAIARIEVLPRGSATQVGWVWAGPSRSSCPSRMAR